MATRERASWDAEYQSGRYEDEPPVGFVDDIVREAQALPHGAQGLYVGCGNGRNYLPLRAAGLALKGLDISDVALTALARRAPAYAADLVHGSVEDLPEGESFDLVIGIQVFQHGNRATAHALLQAALERVRTGGLFCVRVNAVGTDVHPAHLVTEEEPHGGFTVQYLEGSKQGLDIHFFSLPELNMLLPPDQFVPVLEPRTHQTHRSDSSLGQWSQWEAIYRRTTAPRA
ncbi:MAG: class I SAM-dependent methyltransferase [Streptomyces sp.]|jgi:SAM-dependent methyltransferase|nr:class I SAM-dependent methyltransferase [Streptomyces sp.]